MEEVFNVCVEGHEFLLCEEGFKLYLSRTWSVRNMRSKRCLKDRWTIITNNKAKLPLYRILTQCPKGKVVDHINRNNFDNRLSNLRICTNAENIQNQDYPKRATITSKYKNVSWMADRKRWRAQIQPTNQKKISLGNFTSDEEAAKVYDQAAVKYFGEFANLNFPELLPEYLANLNSQRPE